MGNSWVLLMNENQEINNYSKYIKILINKYSEI
jgi:hypothetical protein